MDREFRGVVVAPHADASDLGAGVVDAIGNGLAEVLILEVMDVDLVRIAVRTVIASRVLEIADQFLRLGVDRYDRRALGMKGERLRIEMLELGSRGLAKKALGGSPTLLIRPPAKRTRERV